MNQTFDATKEILLQSNDNRFVVFPIQHQDLWTIYKKALASFWITDEIDFTEDKDHYKNKLTDNERFFIKNILAFFAFSDGIVNENLAINFYNEIQIPEARQVYATQICIEAIHAETYSLMIDTFITDLQEKEETFNSLQTNSIVRKKADWAMKWLDPKNPFNMRLLAFIIIEGVFFSGSFCAIYWLNSRNLMPGLSLSNQFISRDESLHCKTGVVVYSKLLQKLDTKIVHEIFQEALEIETEFITKSLPVSLIGMNASSMIQYIKFVCDYWISQLNYPTIYNVKNPFSFMDNIGLYQKNNFFEKRGSNYSKFTVTESEFSLDHSF